MIEELIGRNRSVRRFDEGHRDERGVHHVPKRRLEDIVFERF
jgi:hypothetical protein